MIQPDRIAMLDQVGTDLAHWAKLYGNFHRDLMSEGLDRHEALEIVLGWQNGLIDFQIRSVVEGELE